MSRIGKKPILIPAGTQVKVENSAPKVQKVLVSGKLGELSRNILEEVRVEIKDGKVFVFPQIDRKQTNAFLGLTRALVANMIEGVTKGLEFIKNVSKDSAQLKGDELELKVGYINTIKVKAPSSIKFSTDKNVITVSGIDNELVGQVAAKIRKVKPAEPYKGKGIKYFGEVIRRKVGKRVTATAGAA